MLSKKKCQTYLKELGFYKGNIDGIIGVKTKAAYKALQEKYFERSSDIDGIYGKNTDILLQNAYNVKKYCPNFKLEEFKCGCNNKYCTGYPTLLNVQLLKNIQAVRSKYGPTVLTSGLRCKKHNASLPGHSKTSRHMSGKAVDFKNNFTKTQNSRIAVMSYWKTLPKYRYTYCNISGSNPGMGTAVHGDVK